MAPVRLARDYVGRDGAPVIHAIDPAIFSLRYFMRCLACGFCNDQCCDHGVDIDVDNARRLRELGPDFQARLAVPAAHWFTSDVTPDIEFPSGAHVRTQVRNGKCVFTSQSGRGCTIHAYCLEKGIDYHTLKPMVSALFPVTFEAGVLVPSAEAMDGTLLCSGAGATLYEGVRGELEYYFGHEFVAELETLKKLVMARDTGPPR
jgi:hypothetical protein